MHPFQNFLTVLPPPTVYNTETRKNSGYTRPTLFVGRGEGLGLCELENAQFPKTFVHIELNSINCRFEGLLKVYFNAKPLNFV